MAKYYKYPLLLPLLLLTACEHGRTYFPRDLQPIEVGIIRFDEALLNVRRESVETDVRVLYDEYEEFMPVWVEDILGLPTFDTAYLCQQLPDFLEDTLYGFAETNRRAKEEFANISDIEHELATAFARIQYLWPDMPLPNIYFMVSGFAASIYFFGDSEDENIAVGTDMYLGSDWDWYNRVVYNYQKQTMSRAFIAGDVVSAYLFRHLPYTGRQNRLIDNMIYRGKMLYLLSQLLDEQPWDVMGYTREQWEWCTTNERAIWHYMMDRKDLFKTESMLITSYLNDGPFCSEVSQECPARVGTWIGWRIAESYMNHNEHVTLQSLIDCDDAQYILENSYYKP